MPTSIHTLNEVRFSEGLTALTNRDPALHNIVERYGPPPFWVRQPGFPTLIHIILEQQVSLASARAAFTRLEKRIGPITPEGFLALDDKTLLQIGFSRQKRRYGRLLAGAIVGNSLDLSALDSLTDSTAEERLVSLKGIGPWTAQIYLLMALRRKDIWPSGDLALQIAAQKLHGLENRPGLTEMEQIGIAWSPYRAIAARVLWHFYLSQ